MLTKYLSTIIAALSVLLVICIVAIGFMLWRGHVMQAKQDSIATNLAAATKAIAAQKKDFDSYRKQTDDMRNKLDTATQQAASTKTELQDALNDETNQTWGNTRLPDSIGGLLNR